MPNVIDEYPELAITEKPKGYYVYGWVCADWGGIYFYVGKGKGNRYESMKNRSLAFEAILENWNCFPVILVDGLTEEEAYRVEEETKLDFIFDRGYPIMDGESGTSNMKVQAMVYAKKKKRACDPNYKEGRKEKEKPENYDDVRGQVNSGEITVVAACDVLGISRSLWYKWAKEVV